ncbi:MAG: sulfite exporter TauE/SafE family protein [Rhodoferax sp.]|nr:sulfite exporter TauE/SafE family protein [Rhodoferax sp.]
MDAVWIAIGGFIFLAVTLEAVTGFGSIVIALALGAQLVPMESLLPVLVPLSVCLSSLMVWRHREKIDRPLLLRQLLPGMLIGTLLGYLVKPYLDAGLLRQLFGLLIIWFAARELWRLRHATPFAKRPTWLTRVLTGLAGVTHGLFASGGPLLVYAVSGLPLDKARFRATLAAVWLTLNGVLTVAFALDGRLQPALPLVAAYIPLLLMGVYLGEKLHHRVSERHFRIAIYILLLVTGALLARPR